ncbi:MAG: acyltransferase [Oscillospiraceae bacterium]|nr:acyltransferase [Oscillospiraceae bacterium]
MFVILLLAPLIIGSRFIKNDNEIFGLDTTQSLKGLFACFVLLHHLFPFYVHMFPSLETYKHLGFIAVSGFFMISGYGLTYGVIKRDGYLKGFIIKRMLPIVVSYYISALLYLFMFWYNHSLSPEQASIILTAKYYWFFFAILIFYLGFYFSFKIFPRKIAMLLSCFWIAAYIAYMSFRIASSPDINGFWLINSSLAFPFGIALSIYKDKIVKFIKKRYIIKLIVCSAVFAASFAGELLITEPRSLSRLTCELIASVSLCALITVLSVRFRLKSAVLEWFGKISFELYLMFAAFQAFFYNDQDDFGKSIIKIVLIIVCTVISAWIVRLVKNLIMQIVRKVCK